MLIKLLTNSDFGRAGEVIDINANDALHLIKHGRATQEPEVTDNRDAGRSPKNHQRRGVTRG